ncbi:MAG: protein kinase [Sandaracinaceae bacterium]|nr:protein kinase [Sandaracinaceae bacterium]
MSTNAEPTPDEQTPEKVDRWVGRTISGTFRLEELIGEGAMGRVYSGVQLSLNKRIAVKVLHNHLGGDPRIAKRFHREAKAASRLSHPNSLQIIDFGGDDDGTLFIAMELLDGEDLQTIIDHDCPLTPARIADLMRQTLSALDEAHHSGIIHRDLKPENVVVIPEREGERVKVCDFGIAKIVESEGRSTAITKDGYVCGTPEYMAPEQARGEEIDARADVYSAGVMLYQLLCERVPFKAENALGVITKHLMEQPKPPRRVKPTWGIPRSLERIALKALEKDPKDRYASAKEMSRAIDEAMIGLGDLATHRLGEGPFASDGEVEPDEEEPAPTATEDVIAKVVAPPSRGWMYALALSLVALAGAIVWYAQREPAPPRPPVASPPEGPDPEPEPIEAPTPPDPEPVVRVAPPEPPPAPPVEEAPTPRRRSRRAEPTPEAPPAAAPATELERGHQAMLDGDLSGAIALFERFARAHPQNARVQQQLGRAYMRSGDVPRGVAAYRRYLRLAPNAPDRAIVERILAPHDD